LYTLLLCILRCHIEAFCKNVFDVGDLSAKLLEQVRLRVKRRDKKTVQKIFNKYSNMRDGERRLPKDRFHLAVTELGIKLDAMGAEALFHEFDTDKSCDLNLIEFQLLLSQQKSTPLLEWAKSLDIHEFFAMAIPLDGEDALRAVSRLTVEQIDIICEAMQLALVEIVRSSVQELNNAYTITDTRRGEFNSKYNIVPLSCGKVDDFFTGMEVRIGASSVSIRKTPYSRITLYFPKICNQSTQICMWTGNPSLLFEEAMIVEHTGSFDSYTPFTSH
jgi:hypothetical protein